MLALGIRYLTGYAVATDVSNRDRAEWPPHPARVYMAMAAALFETGEAPGERAALEWLEEQGAPDMKVSEAEARDVVTHFVPINDNDAAPVKKNKALMPLQSVPIGRDRQPRTFPRVRPVDDVVTLLWPHAEPSEGQCAALDSLCGKVTRIGHSSSLVQMWVIEPGTEPEADLHSAEMGEHRLRIVSSGTLDHLASSFNLEAIEAYGALQDRIATAKGKVRTELKKESLERFGLGEPTSLRPTASRWQAYRRTKESTTEMPHASGVFDREIMVLTVEEGPTIGLESTWQLLTTLHKTIVKCCDPSPEWLSGHQADGSPSQQPHVALLPLAFVGHEHADGHLMGIGLALPKNVPARERGRALRALLYDDMGAPKWIELTLGSLGKWMLTRETRLSPPRSLGSETWTGPSDTWATVTPIVLDRHPKTARSKNREIWSAEVADILAESCERQGLPRPVQIDIDKTSWHRGIPRAVPGKGGGFPLMPVKEGQTKRQQVHAWLRFNRLIEGPLLLGAGRYRGYGLCRPWKEPFR